MDWVDKPQNYKDLLGILQLLRGSHYNTFPLKTLKLGWVAFLSVNLLISARPQRQTNANECRILRDLDQLESKDTVQKR